LIAIPPAQVVAQVIARHVAAWGIHRVLLIEVLNLREQCLFIYLLISSKLILLLVNIPHELQIIIDISLVGQVPTADSNLVDLVVLVTVFSQILSHLRELRERLHIIVDVKDRLIVCIRLMYIFIPILRDDALLKSQMAQVS
jgi:hypothetical protein